MNTVTITHTAAEGTLATGDTRPYPAIFRAHRRPWSRMPTAPPTPSGRPAPQFCSMCPTSAQAQPSERPDALTAWPPGRMS